MLSSTLKLALETEEFDLHFSKLDERDKSKEDAQIKDCIEKHWFNQSLDLIVPCRAEGLELQLARIQTENPELFEYFLIKSLPLSHLTKPDFIGAFLKRGQVSLLSDGSCLDGEDCAALLSTGELVLHLTEETYERLQLTGNLSHYNTKRRRNHVVTIDLVSPLFKPGSKYYEHVKKILTESKLSFDFFASWIPDNKDVHPVSLAEYFKNFDVNYKEKKTIVETCKQENVTVPTLDSGWLVDAEDESEEIENLYEWLGAVNCGIVSEGDPAPMEVNSDSDPAVCHCACSSTKNISNLDVFHVSGFLPVRLIERIYEIIREHMKTAADCGWMSLTVHGFNHSPVLLNSSGEPGIYTIGMNSYTLLPCRDDRQYLIRETVSP
ncbi:ribonuclease P protein subunit p40-like [Tubulanus polymorphus]|uniref:ribonuclease P protein subunit p40-like n=1 Tax=Tubulanus polymorphus TaxID=672921 RepID=UPI003DA2D54A